MAESRTYGYARVSTDDQTTDRQIDQLLPLVSGETAAEKMRHLIQEHGSGATMERPAWKHLTEHLLRDGDTLVVTSLDRMGRSYAQIVDEWRALQKKGVQIHVLDMPMLSGTAGVGDPKLSAMLSEIALQLLAWVADTERERIRKRQREGIDAARARGVRFGHEETIPDGWANVYDAWTRGEMTAAAAWRRLEIGKTKFYRLAKRMREHGHV